MKYSSLVPALVLLFPIACSFSSGSKGVELSNSTVPATDVQKAFRNFQDLNSTRANLTGELTAVRDQLFALPKGAPLTMELTRKYATLNSQVSKLALEVTSAEFEWRAELQKAEEKREQEEKAKEEADANKIVAEEGVLKLYPFSIKSDPNTGTSSVKGRVENSGSVSTTDVTVIFELFDSEGKSVGTASDFIASIEPNSDWDFNALSPVDGATRAEFKSLKASGGLPPLPEPSKPE